MNLINRISILVENQKVLKSIFFLFLSGIVLTRIFLLQSININFIDSDTPFMWMGAADYANGFFYEPRYYGQNYNTFMEGLFAVPLLWIGVPVYRAVAIATHFIFLFPFLATAWYLYRKHFLKQALFALAVPLCLPLGYDILTGIPRGFITGLFFTGFFIRSILYPNNLKSIAFNTIMAVLAYFVNANSILVSVPFLGFLFFHNYQNKNYYLVSITCFLSAVLFYFLFDRFYVLHPDYIVYALVNEFSIKYFLHNITHLDEVFVHVSFFNEGAAFLLVLIYSLLSYLIFRSNRKGFYACLLILGIVLFSFFASKVCEGATWPYYSFSRMFLGIPIAFVLFGALLNFKQALMVAVLVIVTIIFSAFKLLNFEKSVAYYTDQKKWSGVHLVTLNNALDAIQFYKAKCKEQQVDTLIMANRFWANTFLNYGSHAVDPTYPFTSETNSERRYTIREELKNKVIHDFVYISTNYNLDKNLRQPLNFKIQRLDDYGLFVVRNNTLTFQNFSLLVKNNEPIQ